MAFEIELVAIKFLEGFNQAGLAMKIHCVLCGLGFYPAESDGAAVLG